MKAPDKIYVLCCDNGDLGDVSLYPEGERSKEYIRKDALLEWAKAKHMELAPPQNERDFGRIEAVKELIDKINSL